MQFLRYNLDVSRGASLHYGFQFLDSEGQPLDFSGYSVDAHIKNRPSDTIPQAVFTASLDVSGSVVLQLGPSTPLTSSCYCYDVRVSDSSEAHYIMGGKLVVRTSITF